MITPKDKKAVLRAAQELYRKFKQIERKHKELTEYINWIQENYEYPNIEHNKEVHVHVDDSAFLTMLTSSVESYPSNYMGADANERQEGEVVGHLYGDVEESEDYILYHIRAASVMHNYIEQTDAGCEYSDLHYQKIRYVTDAFRGIRLIGRFHSHPYLYRDFTIEGSHFSETDQDAVRGSLGEYTVPPLEVIFALSYLTKEKYKSPKNKGPMIINYCKNYKYILRCFAHSFNTGGLENVDQIRCKLAETTINC